MNIEIKIYGIGNRKKVLIDSAFFQCEPEEVTWKGREFLQQLGEMVVDVHLCWFEVEILTGK